MFGRVSGFIASFSLLLFSIVLGASSANAAVHIFEVQESLTTQAERVLVIYGTDFGTVDDMVGTPVIHFGTQALPLTIASPADQALCTSIGVPPPLDPAGIDCVVAFLPVPTPDGDYLLWLDGEVPAASCADGKPIQLTFQYTEPDCGSSTYLNGTEKLLL